MVKKPQLKKAFIMLRNHSSLNLSISCSWFNELNFKQSSKFLKVLRNMLEWSFYFYWNVSAFKLQVLVQIGLSNWTLAFAVLKKNWYNFVRTCLIRINAQMNLKFNISYRICFVRTISNYCILIYCIFDHNTIILSI